MAELKPIRPGEKCFKEFMRPYKLKNPRLALALRLPTPTILPGCMGRKRPVSSEMALRLARLYKTAPEFSADLPASFELRVARAKAEQRVKREVRAA